MKTPVELEQMDWRDREKYYATLSYEDKKELIKKVKSSLSVRKKNFNHACKLKSDFEKQCNTQYHKLESVASELSHNFYPGDIVALQDGTMAKIESRVGVHHYKIFEQCKGLRTRLGISIKIHERDICCHALDLQLNKGFVYRENGWRKVNSK